MGTKKGAISSSLFFGNMGYYSPISFWRSLNRLNQVVSPRCSYCLIDLRSWLVFFPCSIQHIISDLLAGLPREILWHLKISDSFTYVPYGSSRPIWFSAICRWCYFGGKILSHIKFSLIVVPPLFVRGHPNILVRRFTDWLAGAMQKTIPLWVQ